MKTILLQAPGDITVIDQEVDQSFERMALVRVISSGLCAADSYLWSGNHPWDITYPIVPGHEIFGEILEISPEYSSQFSVGSKVCVQVIVPCEVCDMCRAKKHNMCSKRRHFGSTFKGSFAEQIAIPFGSRMHSYSAPIDDLVGGLSETMANAIYCAEKVNLYGTEAILILGMGSIGGCLSHYLKVTFPRLRITVLTSSDEKRNLLQSQDIKFVSLGELDSLKNSFDVIFETSGFKENFHAGIRSLRPTGVAMIYGVFSEEFLFDFNQVSEFKELTLIGGHLASDAAFDQSVEFLSSNQGDLSYLVSNVVGFSNFASAFSSPKFSQFKTIFQPDIESEFKSGL